MLCAMTLVIIVLIFYSLEFIFTLTSLTHYYNDLVIQYISCSNVFLDIFKAIVFGVRSFYLFFQDIINHLEFVFEIIWADTPPGLSCHLSTATYSREIEIIRLQRRHSITSPVLPEHWTLAQILYIAENILYLKKMYNLSKVPFCSWELLTWVNTKARCKEETFTRMIVKHCSRAPNIGVLQFRHRHTSIFTIFRELAPSSWW